MKLAFLHPGDLDGQSGGYFYDRQLIAGLSSLGWRVEPFRIDTPHGREEFLAQRLGEDWDVVVEDGLGFAHLTEINGRLRDCWTGPVVGFLQAPSCLLATDEHERARFVRQERAYVETLHHAVFVSETCARDAWRLLGPGIPTDVIPPGGDHTPCATKSRSTQVAPQKGLTPERPLRLLTVANARPNKGLAELLEQLAQLTVRDSRLPWSLTVAGSLDVDREYGRSLAQRAREKDLRERVSFTGPADGQTLTDLYENHDVFILPSFYESFGLALWEAFSYGLPTISWSRGGPEEWIVDGRNGWLLSGPDPASLHECLLTLSHDPSRLCTMSLSARETYLCSLTWQAVAEQWDRVLREVIRRR